MNKKIPVAQFYDRVNLHYQDLDCKDEIKWIRKNIPELSLWSDLQIIEMGYNDYSQTQERMTFQTPLYKDMFKDYAIAMYLYKLTPDDINVYDCEDKLLGLYNAWNNDESLNKWDEFFGKVNTIGFYKGMGRAYYCDATRVNLEGLTTIIPLSEHREVYLFHSYFEIFWSTKDILVAISTNEVSPNEIKIEFKNEKWILADKKN